MRKITWFYVAGAFVGSLTPLLCQILIYLVLKAGTANLAQKIVLCLISACFVPFQIKAAVRYRDLVKYKIKEDKKVVKVGSVVINSDVVDSSAPIAVNSAVVSVPPINICYNIRCKFNTTEKCGITTGLWINDCGFCLNTEFKPQTKKVLPEIVPEIPLKTKDIVDLSIPPGSTIIDTLNIPLGEVKKLKNVKPKKTKKQVDF